MLASHECVLGIGVLTGLGKGESAGKPSLQVGSAQAEARAVQRHQVYRASRTPEELAVPGGEGVWDPEDGAEKSGRSSLASGPGTRTLGFLKVFSSCQILLYV